MGINELVVDSELFSKISSDDNKYEDIHQLIVYKIKNNDFDKNDLGECTSFVDILKAIKNEKCVFAYNDETQKKCIEIVGKCPKDIKEMFIDILRKEPCCKKIEDYFDTTEKELFKDSLLESKIPFINVAYHLSNKLIISTKEEIETKYENCFTELCEVRVVCKSACEVKEEIYR